MAIVQVHYFPNNVVYYGLACFLISNYTFYFQTMRFRKLIRILVLDAFNGCTFLTITLTSPSFTFLYGRKGEMRGTQNEDLFSGLD